MYRFDDKRRRQLLEDALVADLLQGALLEGAATHAEEASHNVSSTATRTAAVQSNKSKA
jgi:hypothetical protein